MTDLLGLVVGGLVLLYVFDVLAYPDRPCKVCKGKGRHTTFLPFARDATRDCWWCRGRPRRKRWRSLRGRDD